jgi:hypothetical protein
MFMVAGMLSVAITLGADTSFVVPLDSDALNCACSKRVLDTSQPAVSVQRGHRGSVARAVELVAGLERVVESGSQTPDSEVSLKSTS